LLDAPKNQAAYLDNALIGETIHPAEPIM